MLDIKFLRSNPEIVKQNIKNKFQDEKLPLVDEVIELDLRNREIQQAVIVQIFTHFNISSISEFVIASVGGGIRSSSSFNLLIDSIGCWSSASRFNRKR